MLIWASVKTIWSLAPQKGAIGPLPVQLGEIHVSNIWGLQRTFRDVRNVRS